MENRHTVPKLMRQHLPVILAACFFALSACAAFRWAVSPGEQARALLRDMFTYSIYEYDRPLPSGSEALDMPDAVTQRDYGYPMPVERVTAGDIVLEPVPGEDAPEYAFRYELDYYVVLFKGDEPVTPVIPEKKSGIVSVRKTGPFSWDIAGIN